MSSDRSDWKDMPEPSPLLTLSWEDVLEKAREETQSKFQREPTRDEVTTIFENIKNGGMDCADGTFWGTVEYHVSEFYRGVDE